ncbi:HNH endonuclease signature motif containing protein, partial [Mycobacterium asiaticum]|uniref:HNH endonuclease signature motif containing protein n=1 Tax=Mycobacterium asiaticum TaxID=1790 RepID=UPI0012DB55EB
VIRKFFATLPDTVDAPARAEAEAKLALFATGFRPDELAEYARVYKDCLKPNGDFDPDKPAEPARNRGITLGKQQPDGLSKISGYISAECRATVEPVLAKLAAPGMCNPADDAPVIDGRAPAQAVDRDTRTAAQRNHDALNTALRALLTSKTLGQHHGLPTSIIITTTLAELEAGAGRALTAGGTLLPMAEVIRLASHAHNYLAIFDKDKTLALYHGKRLATPEQRLVLLARDRGCTRPGCTVPGYWTQVHHLEGWLAKRRTHIDELTLACGPDNRMVELRNYLTRRNTHGDTEWIPP